MARAPINTLSSSLRNHIINSNFDYWQRGNSNGTSTGKRYLADRFFVESVGTTYSNDRISFTAGQTEVPNEPRYYNQITHTVVAGASNYCLFSTALEDVRALAGKTVTLTFWVKASVGRNIAVEFFQNFGSGGSPSSSVLSIGVTTIAVTTAWTKKTVTVNIPSISGKTVGTTENSSYLGLNFWIDAGSTFNARTNSLGQQGSANVQFAQMMLAEGSSPVNWVSAGGNPARELILCQRYYEKSFPIEFVPGTLAAAEGNSWAININSASTRVYIGFTQYKVQKRGTSNTFRIFNQRGDFAENKISVYNGDTNQSITLANASANQNNFAGYLDALANDTIWGFHWTVDSDF